MSSRYDTIAMAGENFGTRIAESGLTNCKQAYELIEMEIHAQYPDDYDAQDVFTDRALGCGGNCGHTGNDCDCYE